MQKNGTHYFSSFYPYSTLNNLIYLTVPRATKSIDQNNQEEKEFLLGVQTINFSEKKPKKWCKMNSLRVIGVWMTKTKT